MKFILGNAYYLSTGSTSILIDAGVAIRTMVRNLKEYHIDIRQIDAVFITHDHADHIKSVGYLANDYNRMVYATEPVHMGINRNYCVSSKLTSDHIRYIQKDAPIQIGDLCITPFDVPHDSSDCVGYSAGEWRHHLLPDYRLGHWSSYAQDRGGSGPGRLPRTGGQS